jgi:serine/threonine protein kinase
MVESFVTKITNDGYMINILAIIIIINSFIEFYGIHKKCHWVILFSCMCKLSAIVYIIVHIYITSGNNYLLAAVSWFALFYIAKIKIVSKSQENSVHDVLPKFHGRKQSHVSMTSIVTSSNESEKKIAPKSIEVIKSTTPSSCAKNNPEFDRLYTISGMLGKGGFGQVYSGVRNSDLKPVAIKIIKKQTYCSKLVWPTEFDGQVVPLEVDLMQKLNHIKGVIKLLEYFETLESYILVLERMVPININCEKCQNDCCCEKTTNQIQDLWDFITNHGPLDEDLARKIFSQVVQTIHEITKAGVVHRDIKDENILIDTQNHQIKIIDFGSGAIITTDAEINNNIHATSSFIDYHGTRICAPPEYFTKRCYKADGINVWSLGILLYNMATGDVPFKSDRQIKKAKIQFEENLQLSEELIDLIKQCLTVSTLDRITLNGIAEHCWLKK